MSAHLACHFPLRSWFETGEEIREAIADPSLVGAAVESAVVCYGDGNYGKRGLPPGRSAALVPGPTPRIAVPGLPAPKPADATVPRP